MKTRSSSHLTAVLQALLVTFLWSTSWVLIKIGLQDLPALTFAGLRYSLAFLFVFPFALRPALRGYWRNLEWKTWASLALLGVLYYALTQGAQFVALSILPAVTVSLLLNFTSPLVAFLGIWLLHERPTGLQWAGVILFLLGLGIYFYPPDVPLGEVAGLVVALAGVVANALSSLLGRAINRGAQIPPILVTTVSMGVGALLLLSGGVAVQGLPSLGPPAWAIILWLALVNTAFAFTLWNRTLQTLSALESSLINGTMLIQIAVLSWAVLGERISAPQALGLAMAGLGAAASQVRRDHLMQLFQRG